MANRIVIVKYMEHLTILIFISYFIQKIKIIIVYVITEWIFKRVTIIIEKNNYAKIMSV